MGRPRKGKPVSGWLIVDKPAGVGSTQVVAKVRWALGAQKAGHAGTLDPAATGVLAIALGEATKTVPYLVEAMKCYRFEVRWGASTVTDDATGDVLATSPERPSRPDIEAALEAFRGDIMQVPPQVSAVHVNGERAYDLVRDGEEVELDPRELHVEKLELIEAEFDTAVFEMACGKGGYVRSIARDLGEKLGCLGHVGWLRRIWSGPFHVDDALTVPEIERLAGTDELRAHVRPLELGLTALPELKATPEGAVRLRDGNPAAVEPTDVEEGAAAWVSFEGKAMAVGHYRDGEMHPVRVFLTEGA